MLESIAHSDIPAMAGNRLYLDYVSGESMALRFYSHAPLDFSASLSSRSAYTYPRERLSAVLRDYNRSIGSSAATLDNIAALAKPDTYCVICGQQAGFLGGPVYTVYKIATTIRLAEALSGELPVRVVPVFWLASEDHDFHEINHVYLLKSDGEVGRVSFNWEGQGRPVADLPLTGGVLRAFEDYFGTLIPDKYAEEARSLFLPGADESYCRWQARFWSALFAGQGLIVVEPHLIRPLAGDFFLQALRQVDEIDRLMAATSRHLEQMSYEPQLISEQAGHLYTFSENGQRIRVERPEEHLEAAIIDPVRYSTDAALRPLLADAVLPVVADVLGPGEIAYQGMLKPLHELFEIPQPALFPRKHYTIVSGDEARTLARYNVKATSVICGELDVSESFESLVPESEREVFQVARQEIESALAPLEPYVEGIDLGLARTWEGVLQNALRSLDKLEERAMKARMSQLGLSKQELRAVRNSLLPRGRLQERVLPLPHFVNRHGTSFITGLLHHGDLNEFAHHILTLEDNDAPG